MDWCEWAARDPKVKASEFAEFHHPSVLMTDSNKMTRNEYGELPAFDFKNDTAYHMDATLFGQYLKKNFCQNVEYIRDHIVTTPLKEDGGIKHLVGENGKYEADLFVDCSGFASVLLEGKMNVPFESFGNTLLNDRACAAQIPYIDKDKEMESVTNCTAIEAGWVWNIPLYTRIGTGYVYSSKHASEDEAEAQFRAHLAKSDPKRAEEAKVFHLKIKHGIHTKSWVKNVVAVGLSSGFIEPLESTGLMLTHENILHLLRTLGRRKGQVNRIDIDNFNFAIKTTMEGFRQFIGQHYSYAGRNDTPYWKEVTQGITYSKSVDEFRWPETSRNDTHRAHVFALHNDRVFHDSLGGALYILTGQGYNPVTPADIVANDLKFGSPPWENIRDRYIERKSKLQELIDLMPSHYEFLTDEFYIKKDVKTGGVHNGSCE